LIDRLVELDHLKPLGLSQYQLAKDVGVPPRRINEIVLGKRAGARALAGRHRARLALASSSCPCWTAGAVPVATELPEKK
jgi:hypothetical protein